MADPFDTFGVMPAFDIDLGALEQRYRDLSRVLHPDRHVGEPASERRMALGRAVEVNEAWRVLRDPLTRAEALLRRLGLDPRAAGGDKAAPAFLMDMMEQREALSDARRSGDATRVARLAAEIARKQDEAMAKLSGLFQQLPPIGAPPPDAAASRGAAVPPPDTAASRGAAVPPPDTAGPPLGAALHMLGELRYYRRFLDEVSAIDDEQAEASL